MKLKACGLGLEHTIPDNKANIKNKVCLFGRRQIFIVKNKRNAPKKTIIFPVDITFWVNNVILYAVKLKNQECAVKGSSFSFPIQENISVVGIVKVVPIYSPNFVCQSKSKSPAPFV